MEFCQLFVEFKSRQFSLWASMPPAHSNIYISKKKLSDCFNRWNNNQRTNNARDQLDSDVAMDKFDQLNAAAHNTKGVLLIWNMLLYNIVYFVDLTTLYYADLHLFCLYRVEKLRIYWENNLIDKWLISLHTFILVLCSLQHRV